MDTSAIITGTSNSGGLKFSDIIRYLGSLYRRGVLVPFIGLGMSRPACSDWDTFIANLAGASSTKDASIVATTGNAGSGDLYRMADTLVDMLRHLPSEERADKYRAALRDPAQGPAKVPPQTVALGQLAWPLMVTTNYDDLYWTATHPAARPEVLGRGRDDCHRLLRSLDQVTSPFLWALQGFLGGQCTAPELIVPDTRKRRTLAQQVVVGHQQYQRATNADPHFRRAFAEVFRRRSLLFLGSGVLEDYFVNLFGEIIHHQGSGAFPHFALLPIWEHDRYESRFLQTRLGIVPVFYDDYKQLPVYLDGLTQLIKGRTVASPTTSVPSPVSAQMRTISYELSISGASSKVKQYTVTLHNSLLPAPDPDAYECSLASVGRDLSGPILGRQAVGLLERCGGMDSEWKPLDPPECYVFRSSYEPVFAVAARRPEMEGHGHDQRDLGVVPVAVRRALQYIDRAGYQTVKIGAVASGRLAPWHPIHPFAETLRGIRHFITQDSPNALKVFQIYVDKWQVWDPIVAGRLPVAELLSSDLSTHQIEVADPEGEIESFAVTLCGSHTLGQVLKEAGIDSDKWSVELSPEPTGIRGGAEPPADMEIAPTMKVILIPRLVR